MLGHMYTEMATRDPNQENTIDTMIETKKPHLSSTSTAEVSHSAAVLTEMRKRDHNQENPSDSMINSTSMAEANDSVASLVTEMEKSSHKQENPSDIMTKTKRPRLSSTEETDNDAQRDLIQHILEKIRRPASTSTSTSTTEVYDSAAAVVFTEAAKTAKNPSDGMIRASETDMVLEIARLRNIIARKDDNAEIRSLKNIIAQKNGHIDQLVELFGEISELQNIRLEIRKAFDKALSNSVRRTN